MDDRIWIRTYRIKNGYRSYVRVNGDPYAVVDAPTREQAIAEANHYAAQIEFDEFGNW